VKRDMSHNKEEYDQFKSCSKSEDFFFSIIYALRTIMQYGDNDKIDDAFYVALGKVYHHLAFTQDHSEYWVKPSALLEAVCSTEKMVEYWRSIPTTSNEIERLTREHPELVDGIKEHETVFEELIRHGILSKRLLGFLRNPNPDVTQLDQHNLLADEFSSIAMRAMEAANNYRKQSVERSTELLVKKRKRSDQPTDGTQLAAVQKELTVACNDLQQIENANAALQDDVADWKAQSDASAAEVAYLKAQFDASAAEVAYLKANVTASAAEVAYLKANVTALEADLHKLQSTGNASDPVAIGNDSE